MQTPIGAIQPDDSAVSGGLADGGRCKTNDPDDDDGEASDLQPLSRSPAAAARASLSSALGIKQTLAMRLRRAHLSRQAWPAQAIGRPFAPHRHCLRARWAGSCKASA